jgi:hypothetical protein
MDFSFLSLQVYVVTMLKDSGEIRIYSFGNACSPKRLTHVATLHLPLPHDHCVLLELTTMTGPFLVRPPAGADSHVADITLVYLQHLLPGNHLLPPQCRHHRAFPFLAC